MLFDQTKEKKKKKRNDSAAKITTIYFVPAKEKNM